MSDKVDKMITNVIDTMCAENTCWNCDEPCSLFSEYQDDGRTFCSLDCLNEADTVTE